MEPSKLPVKFSPAFFGNLKHFLGILELSSRFNIIVDGINNQNIALCNFEIALQNFPICQEFKGRLNELKLQDDCVRIYETLKNLHDELLHSQSFATFTKTVDDNCTFYMNRLETVTNYYQKKAQLKELYEKIIHLHGDLIEKLRAMDKTLFQTKLNVAENEQRANIDKKLMLTWIADKKRQNVLKFQVDEKKINENLKRLQDLIRRENVSRRKIENYYDLKVAELQKETLRMSEEYDQKLDEVELKLQIVKNTKNLLNQAIESEGKIFTQRQLEMDEYIAIRNRKAAEKLLRELHERNATFIQAWWRGCLVRHHLGPFKMYFKRAKAIRKEMKSATKKKK